MVRCWILNSRLDKGAPLATFEGRSYLQLSRLDLWTLKARGWVNSNIIQWMCNTFNDAPVAHFKRDFYCVSLGILETVIRQHNLDAFQNGPVLVYDGFGPNFGDDNRFFDKWFIPMCWKGHWWLYAFNVAQKRVLVIDSLKCEEPTDERRKLDAYAIINKVWLSFLHGRLIEDMSKVAIPTYERTLNGPSIAYASVPVQPNGWDCGIFVIKFMELWTEDCRLHEWDDDMLLALKVQLMLDIVMGVHNESIGQVRTLLEENEKCAHRNPRRNKKKEVKSPFTAPSTRTLMKQVGEQPVKKNRKWRKQ
ncbi:hypothetical protein Ahy_B10g101952 [Arachis hypogaea]|uniref:Ubiquitin-like protease family profile domain-containing protein n=1 Tax=Arachis hypogaea TaxID=3818 RepID=A0A444X0V7_ARAHY|nr:hypothetical protein Ahy_B10g101952 [Arachis hypogaea]